MLTRASLSTCCLPVLRKFGVSLLIILVLSSLSWGMVQIIATYCYPPGWTGPFVALLTMGNPICHTLNTIQVKLADSYLLVFGSLVGVVVLRIGECVNLAD